MCVPLIELRIDAKPLLNKSDYGVSSIEDLFQRSENGSEISRVGDSRSSDFDARIESTGGFS